MAGKLLLLFLKIGILVGFTFMPVFAKTGHVNPNPMPRVVIPFHLPATDGKVYGPASFPNAKGFIVVFTCNHCPFAKLYSKRFIALQNKYSVLGIPLIAINAMDTLVYEEEGMPNMAAFALKEGFNFPYLADFSQTVALNFRAERTPVAYLIWKVGVQLIVKYAGAIDSNGAEPEKATPYLENAIKEALAGKKITLPKSASVGCIINYRGVGRNSKLINN
jgi:thiol-disulfide isomerase/thioredoxin